jgi:D-alanyl-D-alanine carboxypeptidase (penicillin-binding protein 5/6)
MEPFARLIARAGGDTNGVEGWKRVSRFATTKRGLLTGAGALALAGAVPGALRAQAPAAAQTIDTTADVAILIDVGTDTILLEKNADRLVPPASMAKLMTQEVVFHEIAAGRLTLEQDLRVSEFAWRTGGAPSGTSTMFAALNSRVPVRELLRGAIIVSANDACIALAEGISGTEAAFAQLMTRRAREIGLERSTFTNSTGLPDPGLRVTARELARLAIHIQRTYPQFYPWYAEREFRWTVRQPQLNRNPLLREVPGADGLKTGFTTESGFGLTGSVLRGEQRLVVVVNGLRSERERAEESRKLIEWGFRAFETRRLFAEGETVGDAVVFGGDVARVPLVGRGEIRALLPRAIAPRDLRAQIVYAGPLRAPISRGREVARLRVFAGQTLAVERPLLAGADVAVGAFHQRAGDAAWELVSGWLPTVFR